MYRLVCFAAALFCFSILGCKGPRVASGHPTKPKPLPAEEILRELVRNQIQADWFEGRLRVIHNDQYGRTSFIAYVRMARDSAIWMSLKKFSIEAARVLIRPDSVFVIDRLNGEYAAEPFSYLQKTFNIPLGFEGLQALILGNPVFFSRESSVAIDSGFYLLSQKTPRFDAKYRIDGKEMRVQAWEVTDAYTQSKIEARFEDFQPFERKSKFSYFRSYYLTSPELGNSSVEITFTKITTGEPVDLTFDIPDRYEKNR